MQLGGKGLVIFRGVEVGNKLVGIALDAVLSKEYVLLKARSTKIIVYVRAQIDLMWRGGSRCVCVREHIKAFGQSIYIYMNVAVKCFAAYVLCLRAFAESRKETISSVMSVCPVLCPHQKFWHPQGGNFYVILYLTVFRKYTKEFRVKLKSGKNDRYFTWRPTYVYLW
jgi:hypothetical protein